MVILRRQEVVSLERRDLVSLNRPTVVNFTGAYRLLSNNQFDDNLQRNTDRDKGAIIEFLNALNDANFDKSIQTAVPSGLRPGGNL